MLRRSATWVLGLAGLALLTVGAVRVIATSYGSGLVTLMIVGAVLLISPFVISRAERFSLSRSGYDQQLTREIAEMGAIQTAQILDRTELARFADSFAVAQPELTDTRYEDARMHLQETLVQRAAALSRQEKFDAAEVRMLFGSPSLAMRVLAIGMMKGDPALADGATILAALADPRSRTEQYQGLELAKSCWQQLSKSYQSAIHSVIAGSSDIRSGSDGGRLVDEVLALPVS